MNVPNRLTSLVRLTFLLPLLVVTLLLSGCLKVAVPTVPEAPAAATAPSPPRSEAPLSFVPFPDLGADALAVGAPTPYGNTFQKPWVQAMQAARLGNGPGALQRLTDAEQATSVPGERWELAVLRIRVLLQMGQAADALDQLEPAARWEEAFLGQTLVTTSLRGEVLLWLEKTEEARQQVTPLLQAAQGWSFPTEYPLPPSNLKELVAFSTAYLQSLTVMGGSWVLEGEPRKALPWLRATEQEYRRLHQVAQHGLYGQFFHLPPESLYGRALNLAFLGSVELELRPGTDPVAFQQAQDGFQKLRYAPGLLLVEALKARALLQSGQLEAAEAQAQRTLKQAQQAQAADLIWRIAALLGEAQAAQGKGEAAERSYRAAQAALDQVSGTLASDRSRTRFGVGKAQIDQFLINRDWDQQEAAQLFEDLERGRARAFMDLLADRGLTQSPDLPEVQALQALDHRIVQARLQQSLALPEAQEVTPLLQERQTLLQALRTKSPDWAEVFSVEAVSLADLQEQLTPGERMVYVLPPTEEGELRLLVIEAESTDWVTLDAELYDLEEALGDFAAVLGLPDEEEWAAETLVEVLDHPVWSGAEVLYVVPSGPFHFVPWGVVSTEAPVVVLPTGSWRLRKLQPPQSRQPSVVVGNPEFGGVLDPLPGAEAEARFVADLLQTRPLLGHQATWEALQAQVGQGTAVLHLATHGIYESTDPLRSAFFLTDQEQAVPITASQLLQQPLPARLVVLSACETGLGKTVAGEDLLGLSRSFYLGGSVAVLASLWPVEDAGTQQFMQVFYQTARQSGSLADAWWAARQALQDSGFSPSVYGAFVLGGSAGLSLSPQP